MTAFLSLAQAQQSTAIAPVAIILILLLVAIGLAFSIFWIWMLIDCLKSNLPSTEKLVWILVIIFLHGLGALLYYFIGRKKI